ncbi:MAG: hypothetical protein EXX96DRAFT_621330 [Benjaminiella poitrasii]|nr:MAG: hypothetical protein EXX96DRAFT_621330 [Benjaminiella poitrasii]
MTIQDHQDPILTKGSLKKIVENLPGKVKHQHSEYDYKSDSDTFEHELNEFFSYTEVTVQLQEYRRLYERHYPDRDRHHIEFILQELEHTADQEIILHACKNLVYIALGYFTADGNETRKERVDKLIESNNHLVALDAFSIFFEKLQQAHAQYVDLLTTTNSEHKQVISLCTEIDLLITLIYLLLESQRFQDSRNEGFKEKLYLLEPNLAQFLISFIATLKEKQDQMLPIKKSLLYMSGGLKSIKQSTSAPVQSDELDTHIPLEKTDIVTKATLQDLLLFQEKMTEKYPSYIPPEMPLKIATPFTLKTSPSLAAAMGYLNATESSGLVYQVLFHNNPSLLRTAMKQQQNDYMLQNHYFDSALSYYYVCPTFPLPLVVDSKLSDAVPMSIKEAGEVYMSNMYISSANYQIIQERSRHIHKWQQQHETKKAVDCAQGDTFEGLYAKVLSSLPNFITVILTFLLNSVKTLNSCSDNDSKVQLEEKPTRAITIDYLEKADIIRNREIYLKAVSGLLLVLLKWTKSSHILKFEYVSQLLVDSGCLLIILKAIGLQELSDRVKMHTDVPHYSFLDYNMNHEIIDPFLEKDADKLYTNRRNMFWAINYLRIIQMLIKRKTCRIMLLVQYKSSIIFKRVLKIIHPVLEKYVLKLIKCQVPYLGKKWKSQNMKIISSIYLRCTTLLQDEWISKPSIDGDLEEGRIEETILRVLVRLYHGERYSPRFLPLHDEINTEKGHESSGPGFTGLKEYDLHKTVDFEAIKLEPDFLSDYEQWIEHEVINRLEQDEHHIKEDDKQKLQVETPIPLSPWPTTGPGLSGDQLSHELSKLYLQQLNTELKPKTPLTQKDITKYSVGNSSSTEWHKSSLTNTFTLLSRFNATNKDQTDIRPSKSCNVQKYFNDTRNEDDIYNDLISTLIHVENKTIDSWLENSKKEQTKEVMPYWFRMFDISGEEGKMLAETNIRGHNECGETIFNYKEDLPAYGSLKHEYNEDECI